MQSVLDIVSSFVLREDLNKLLRTNRAVRAIAQTIVARRRLMVRSMFDSLGAQLKARFSTAEEYIVCRIRTLRATNGPAALTIGLKGDYLSIKLVQHDDGTLLLRNCAPIRHERIKVMPSEGIVRPKFNWNYHPDQPVPADMFAYVCARFRGEREDI